MRRRIICRVSTGGAPSQSSHMEGAHGGSCTLWHSRQQAAYRCVSSEPVCCPYFLLVLQLLLLLPLLQHSKGPRYAKEQGSRLRGVFQ